MSLVYSAIYAQLPVHELSLQRIEFVLANHQTRNAHVISGNALL